FLLNTYYVPDEYWQSLEVAHKEVFGYGYLSWEWKVQDPIRTPLHMLIFAFLYKFLKITGLDYPLLIVYLPRLLSAFIASLHDFYLLKLAQIHFGKIYVVPVMIFNFTNWFSLFAYPRLIINSLESTLFIISLYYYKLSFQISNIKYDYISRLLVIVNFIMRPTSIIPFVFIWPFKLFTMYGDMRKKIKYFFLNVQTLLLMLTFSIIFDILYFQKFTWTVLNFFIFNVVKNFSIIYGTHDKLWYFTVCIPHFFLANLPFLLFGIFIIFSQKLKSKISESQDILYGTIFYIIFISMIAHKENRFILNGLSILILYAAYGYQNMTSKKLQKLILLLGILSNIILFIFMGFYFQQGSFSIFSELRNRIQNVDSVYFFTECHSTPLYSFLHKNIPMDFPDCSPENRLQEISDSLLLFKDPYNFINNALSLFNYSHIVLLNTFTNLENIQELLSQKGYQKIKEIFHSPFMESPIGDLSNVYFVLYENNNKQI
ncbi:plasmid maintenance protein, putative, partial [Ichthyophthirius multifiliis]